MTVLEQLLKKDEDRNATNISTYVKQVSDVNTTIYCIIYMYVHCRKEAMMQYLNKTEETYIHRNWALMHMAYGSIHIRTVWKLPLSIKEMYVWVCSKEKLEAGITRVRYARRGISNNITIQNSNAIVTSRCERLGTCMSYFEMNLHVTYDKNPCHSYMFLLSLLCYGLQCWLCCGHFCCDWFCGDDCCGFVVGFVVVSCSVFVYACMCSSFACFLAGLRPQKNGKTSREPWGSTLGQLWPLNFLHQHV